MCGTMWVPCACCLAKPVSLQSDKQLSSLMVLTATSGTGCKILCLEIWSMLWKLQSMLRTWTLAHLQRKPLLLPTDAMMEHKVNLSSPLKKFPRSLVKCHCPSRAIGLRCMQQEQVLRPLGLATGLYSFCHRTQPGRGLQIGL